MSKIITDMELVDLIRTAIVNHDQALWANSPKKPLGREMIYLSFLGDLGKVAANYFGGQLKQVSAPDGIEELGYTLSFEWDRQIPADGGVYAQYDTDISIEEWKEETCC